MVEKVKPTTQKNNFMILLMAFMIAVVGIVGCVSTPEHSVEQTATTTTGESASEQEMFKETTIETGVTRTVVTESDNGTLTRITLNRITKTATVEMNPFYIDPPREEDAPIFDGLAFTDELLIPMAAGMMQFALFDPEGLEEWIQESKESGFIVEDDGSEVEEENILEGYTVTKLTIKFIEKGTNTPIADYIITGPTENDMMVTKHR